MSGSSDLTEYEMENSGESEDEYYDDEEPEPKGKVAYGRGGLSKLLKAVEDQTLETLTRPRKKVEVDGVAAFLVAKLEAFRKEHDPFTYLQDHCIGRRLYFIL